MANQDTLFLYEEINLLALHDRKGTINNGHYPYALGGAILAELLLSGRVCMEEEGKKKFVSVQSERPLGDPLVDECLSKIAVAKRRGTVETWVGRFAGIKNIKHRSILSLCQRGILKNDEDKVLWIFTRKIYPEINPVPEKKLIQRLRKAVFTDVKNPDPRTIVLVALANATGLLHQTFGTKELKPRKEHIERLVSGDIVGKAAQDLIQAVNAALLIMVIMPTMITITS